MLYLILKPTNYIYRKAWQITTVTIAAQIGILPLSLYYFHQMPGLFLVTNILILPFLGLILGIGILILILAYFNILPDWGALLYNEIIKLLNTIVAWVAEQSSFLIENIYFSSLKLVGFYIAIISLIFLWKRFEYKRLIIAMGSIALLISIYSMDELRREKDQLIVFHKSRTTLIGKVRSEDLMLLTSDTVTDLKRRFPIKSYLANVGIDKVTSEKIPRYFKYNNSSILIIDSLGVYPKIQNIDVVLLTQSPKLNLERMIDSLHPKTIIADGSNFPWFVESWRNTCKKRKLLFHHTGNEGAFIIE